MRDPDSSPPSATHRPPRTPPAGRLAGLAALLLLGISLAYSNHFDNGFHFDDLHTIVINQSIRQLGNIPRFFTDAATFSTSPGNRDYRPLITLSLAVDYALGGGLTPWAFHASQFLALLVTGGLLFVFYRALLDAARPHPWNAYAALFGAALFCVHTANTETVNYIIARSDLLSTLWVIAAFVLYLRRPAWRRYYLYIVPMALGALCKSPAVMVAPLLLVYVVLFEAEVSVADLFTAAGWKRAWRPALRTAPVFAAGVLLFALTDAMRPVSTGSLLEDTDLPFSRWDYLVTQTTAYVRYLRLFVWPSGLLADTTRPALRLADPRVLGSIAVLGALMVAIGWASMQRATRAVAFGLAWYWIALVPTSSVFPLSQIVSEHRIFFPYVGLMLAAIAAVMRWVCAPAAAPAQARRARPAVLLALAAFGALGLATYERNKVWKTDETIWRSVTETEPDNARAWNNYGLPFAERGELTKARELFEEAIRRDPGQRGAYINLGNLADRMGNHDAAERYFQKALELREDDAGAHYAYALFLLRGGRTEEARGETKRAFEIDREALLSFVMNAYENGDATPLCKLVMGTDPPLVGDPQGVYERVCVSAPEVEAAMMQVGLDALYTRHDPLAAAAQFRQVLERHPTHYGATYQLAVALDQAGQRDQARPLWERALTMAEKENDKPTADTARARLQERP